MKKKDLNLNIRNIGKKYFSNLLRCIDYAGIVSELKHAQYGGKDRKDEHAC